MLLELGVKSPHEFPASEDGTQCLYYKVLFQVYKEAGSEDARGS